MSKALFPGTHDDDHTSDMRALLERRDAAVFFAVRPDGSACGYVEAATRPYAEGCSTSPVGYIEAWYVDPDVRREGYGRALLEAAEAWAVEQGYREMASDALLENAVSHEAHKRSGYVEVERVITYRKPLPERR
jgi:aminoglycoside 6'-N-acetyltransferase I